MSKWLRLILNRKIRLLLIAAVTIPSGISYGGGETDQDEALRLHQSGEILPLSIILEKAQAIQQGKLLETEIKLENGVRIYELEIYGNDGKYYDLEFDARTGRLLKREVE